MLLTKVLYWINKDNIIVRVNDSWDQFAIENDAPTLTRKFVVGKPLYRFVTGSSTQMFVDTMLQSARFKGKPVRQPYRCDSPTQRRYMVMTLVPEDKQWVRVENEIIRIESLKYPIGFFAAPGSSAGTAENKLILRCSMCNRLQVNEVWYESEQAVAEGFVTKSLLSVAYSICPDCKTGLNHAIQQQREIVEQSFSFLTGNKDPLLPK